jgi:hypothetical protein
VRIITENKAYRKYEMRRYKALGMCGEEYNKEAVKQFLK